MKCVCGQPMRQHVISLADIWWICIICGREKMCMPECGATEKHVQSVQEAYQPPVELANTNNTSAPLNQEPVEKKETTMANKRGTCPVCKRKDVLMPSDKKCSRCYDRQKKGLDPGTGKPVVSNAAVGVDTVGLLSIQKPASPPQGTFLEHPAGKPARKREPARYPCPEAITLQFTTARDVDLFAQIHSLAITHRRSLEAEILFMLEDRVMQIEEIYLSQSGVLGSERREIAE